MSNFFKQLSEVLLDKQELTMKIARVGDDFTIHAIGAGKNILCTATPEEADIHFIESLKFVTDKKTFVFKIVDSEEKSDEEENDEIEKESSPPSGSEQGTALAKNKKEADAKIKKLTKDADALFKKRKYTEAANAYEEAAALSEEIKADHSAIDKALAKAKEFIAPSGEVAEEDKPELAEDTKPEAQKEKTPLPIVEGKASEQPSQSTVDPKKATFLANMKKGNDLYALQKYAPAQAAFKDALELYPKDIEANSGYQEATEWVEMENNL